MRSKCDLTRAREGNEIMYHCGCCNRDITSSHWDGLYGSCADCATCCSLEHWPCDHGACAMTPLTRNPTPTIVAEVLREMPNGTVVQQLAEVMRRGKGSANPKQALDMIHDAHKGGL